MWRGALLPHNHCKLCKLVHLIHLQAVVMGLDARVKRGDSEDKIAGLSPRSVQLTSLVLAGLLFLCLLVASIFLNKAS